MTSTPTTPTLTPDSSASAGSTRGRRPLRSALAGLSILCVLMAVAGAPQQAAAAPASELAAVYATGGEGRFTDSIQWLQWGQYPLDSQPENNVVLGYGDQYGDATRTVTNYRYLDDAQSLKLTTTCTLSNLSTDNEGEDTGDAGPVKRAPLVASVPGKWAGDALDNLYNIGGTGHWSDGGLTWHEPLRYPADYVNDNQMAIGLSNGFADLGSSGAGYASQMSFDLECSADLNGTQVPLSGLVLADAEASSAHSVNGYRDEWVQASTPQGNGTSWRVLDTYKDANCPTTTQAIVSDGGDTVRLMPTGEECVYQNGGRYSRPQGTGGPDAVLFMEGSTKARISMQGRGYSAVALGLVVGTDFGDAPASYGRASSLFQPTWTGGQITSTVDAFSVEKATMSSATTRLGAVVDSEGDQKFSDGATGDDLSGSADEDGVVVPADGIKTWPGGTYTQQVSCTGPGTVAGWIDWDRDGVFDETTEKSDEQACTSSGTATLTWTVPNDVVRSVSGETENTYLRVRISNDGNTLMATGNTLTGEVEDYAVNVRVPTLTLYKQVEGGQYSRSQSLLPTAWHLTATGQDGQAAVSGDGWTAETPVAEGTYTLGESSDAVGASSYSLTGATCVDADGQDVPVTGNSVTIDEPDRVSCFMTNTAGAGSITWTKTDVTDGSLLSGSTWTLTGPSYPSGVEVSDCVADDASSCTGSDKDPAAGSFRIEELAWGGYTLTEKAAPAGYTLSTETHEAQIGSSGTGTTVDLGALTNTMSEVPQIPLTGGPSAQYIAIAGGILLAAAATSGALSRRRARKRERA